MSENNEGVTVIARDPVSVLASRIIEAVDEGLFDERVLRERIEAVIRAELSIPLAPKEELIEDEIGFSLDAVEELPAEGLAFAVVTPTADGMLPDLVKEGGPIQLLCKRIRDANPNAHLLVLPAGWSFRTMVREQAIAFVTNILAFVPDDDLEALGLRRIDENDRVEAPPRRDAPESPEAT